MLFPGGDTVLRGRFSIFIKKTFALKLGDGFLLGIALAADAFELFKHHLQIGFTHCNPHSSKKLAIFVKVQILGILQYYTLLIDA